jgi:hypothetical protein
VERNICHAYQSKTTPGHYRSKFCIVLVDNRVSKVKPAPA